VIEHFKMRTHAQTWLAMLFKTVFLFLNM